MQQGFVRALRRAVTIQSGGFGIVLALLALGAGLCAMPCEHHMSLYFDKNRPLTIDRRTLEPVPVRAL